MSIICPNCGSEADESATACDICAEPLTPVVSSNTSLEPSVFKVSGSSSTDRITKPLGSAPTPPPVSPDGRIRVENVDEPTPPIPPIPPKQDDSPHFNDPIHVAMGDLGQNTTMYSSEDHDRRLIQAHRVNRWNFDEMVTKCGLLNRSGYDMYGLFGRPATGKSCFVYALGKHFRVGSKGFGGFTTEGVGWEELTNELEGNWKEGREIGSEEDYYFIYQANNHSKKKHLAILDIAGEHFEKVDAWSEEIFDFFGAYLSRCKGFFVLLDLDEQTVGWSTQLGAKRKSKQLEHIVSFLSVAANIDTAKNLKDPEARRKAIDKARQGMGKAKLKVPVALCLSKADRIHTMNFGPQYGRIIPGDGSPMGSAWKVLETFWPEHFATLLRLAPMLRVDWVSCLGAEFEKKKEFSGSLGLRSMFEHVVLKPPPSWSLSAANYHKFRKLMRL